MRQVKRGNRVKVATDWTPYRPLKCAYHPDKRAELWAKFDDSPGVDLCWDCYYEEVRKSGRLIGWAHHEEGIR